MATVQTRHSTRRVIRRSTLDAAWATVLADLPVELHAPIRRYWEAKQIELQARGDLTVAKAQHRIQFWQIDNALRGLLV